MSISHMRGNYKFALQQTLLWFGQPVSTATFYTTVLEVYISLIINVICCYNNSFSDHVYSDNTWDHYWVAGPYILINQ